MEFHPFNKLSPPEEDGRKPPLIPVLLANFLIMLAYTIPLNKDLGDSITLAFCLFIHAIVAGAGGGILLSTEERHIGKALLTTAVIIPLIGIGWCSVRGIF